MPANDAKQHALDLHRQAIVIDCHSDILIPIMEGKMRLGERVEVPDPATWRPPQGMAGGIGDAFGFSAHTNYFGPMGQYDLPRLVEGGLTAEAFAVYIEDRDLDRPLQKGLEMVWWLYHELEANPGLELVTKAADIRRLKQEGRMGAILSFEGFDALGPDLRLLDLYYKLGLRIGSLTHCRRNYYGDGCAFGSVVGGGLTALGKDAIRRMNDLGIVVDLVHINDVGFFEILELSRTPVVCSHSTGTMFVTPGQESIGPLGIPGRPCLSLPRDRARLEAIAANGGVIGIISFYKETLDDVIADIETALEVMGPDHVGLGSDYYGHDLAPRGLEDISKVPAITERLVERGHSDEVILKVLGGNFMRVFEQVWGG
jgi:membrane dipeptidase